ncbi:hypothetical protein JOC34_004369 [Virgibacillus halotolerans]|nr:hypothetical protein [Virgibacillus halotolerans]
MIKKGKQGKIATSSFLEKEGYLRLSWMVAEGSRLQRALNQVIFFGFSLPVDVQEGLM